MNQLKQPSTTHFFSRDKYIYDVLLSQHKLESNLVMLLSKTLVNGLDATLYKTLVNGWPNLWFHNSAWSLDTLCVELIVDVFEEWKIYTTNDHPRPQS